MSKVLGFLITLVLFSLPALCIGVFYGMRILASNFTNAVIKMSDEQYSEFLEKVNRERQVLVWRKINGE